MPENDLTPWDDDFPGKPVKHPTEMGIEVMSIEDATTRKSDTSEEDWDVNLIFDVTSYTIDTNEWGGDHIDPPGILIWLHGKPDSDGPGEAEIRLGMSIEHARDLARAILAHAVVNPDQN